MSDVIKKLMNAAHRFTVVDFGALKICMLFIGILLGVYFSSFFMKYITIIWIVTILAWLILIVQVIRYLRKQK